MNCEGCAKTLDRRARFGRCRSCRALYGGGGLTFNKHLGRWQILCRDGTKVYFYRAVMEAQLGRPLRSNEHIHHVNGDRTDDRPENLHLLSKAEHDALHHAALVEASKAGAKFEWSREHPHCVVCGETDRPHVGRGRCARCYWRVDPKLVAA